MKRATWALLMSVRGGVSVSEPNLGMTRSQQRSFNFRTVPKILRQASTGSDYVYRTDHGSLNRRLSPEKELSLQQPGQHTPEDGQHYNASHGDTKTNDHHRIGVVVHADISAANAFSPAL